MTRLNRLAEIAQENGWTTLVGMEDGGVRFTAVRIIDLIEEGDGDESQIITLLVPATHLDRETHPQRLGELEADLFGIPAKSLEDLGIAYQESEHKEAGVVWLEYLAGVVTAIHGFYADLDSLSETEREELGVDVPEDLEEKRPYLTRIPYTAIEIQLRAAPTPDATIPFDELDGRGQK